MKVDGSATPVGARRSSPREVARWLLDWCGAATSTPPWLPRHLQIRLTGYVATVLFQAAATILTLAFADLFVPYAFPGLFFLLVVAIVALNWGTGPSLWATALGAALLVSVVLPSVLAPSLQRPGATAGTLLFLAIGTLTSVIASQTEEARRHAHVLLARQEAVIEAIADGVLVYDRDGRILRLNAAMRRMLGLDRGTDDSSHSYAERAQRFTINDEQGLPIPPEQWPTARVLRGEVLIGSASPDLLLRLPDGREILVSMTGAPVRDGAGQLVNAVLVVRDVTARRHLAQRTRAALDALLAMAQALIQEPAIQGSGDGLEGPSATTQGIAQRLVALTAEVLECRRAGLTIRDSATGSHQPIAISGVPAEQARDWWERHERQIAERSQLTSFLQRLRAGEVLEGDMREPPLCRVEDPLAIGAFLVAPMLAGDRLIGHLFIDYGDTPPRRPAEDKALAGAVGALAALAIERDRLVRAGATAARLRELDRLRRDFIATVSHDLQTPLTALRAGLGLLDSSLRGRLTADEGELIGMTRFNIERLRVQIDDLLAANQLEAGTLHLDCRPLDVRSTVRSALSVVQPLFREKGQAVEADLPEPLPISGDSRRLEHVLVNLLANAYRHTPSGSHISITGAARQPEVVLCIRDDGPGIPPEETERIFQRFHRLDTAAGGSGLGLSIARSIITLHGGRLWAESAPGVGAIFHVALPWRDEGSNGELEGADRG